MFFLYWMLCQHVPDTRIAGKAIFFLYNANHIISIYTLSHPRFVMRYHTALLFNIFTIIIRFESILHIHQHRVFCFFTSFRLECCWIRYSWWLVLLLHGVFLMKFDGVPLLLSAQAKPFRFGFLYNKTRYSNLEWYGL